MRYLTNVIIACTVAVCFMLLLLMGSMHEMKNTIRPIASTAQRVSWDDPQERQVSVMSVCVFPTETPKNRPTPTPTAKTPNCSRQDTAYQAWSYYSYGDEPGYSCYHRKSKNSGLNEVYCVPRNP